MLAFLGIEALIFRSGVYASIIEPESSAGVFELVLRREQQAQSRYGKNLIATFGDSQMAYSPRLANEMAAKTGYIFRHAGVAGTNERIWYYTLRDLDPTARRYAALVFPVADYDDEDGFGNPYDDIRALHYTIARLRLSDVWALARSYQDPSLQWQAFRGAMLKGVVYQQDLMAFLCNPGKRLRYVRLANQHYDEWTYNYVETDRSLKGLQVNWAEWKVSFPPDADQSQRDTVQAVLMRRPAPQTGRHASFRRLWYGRILERYRGPPTKIVFLRLPRGPFVRPEGIVKKLSSSIREFGAQPGVLLLDEHAFDSLERPELYKDGLHLNREGIAQFSSMVAEEVSKALGRSGAGGNAI